MRFEVRRHPRSIGFALAAAAALGALAGCASEPAYPSCRNDQACQRDGRREFCLRGRCQQCRGDVDCGAGMTCRENRCVAAPIARGGCDGDRGCAPGQRCVAGTCQAAPSDVAARSDDGGQCTFAVVHFAYDAAVIPDGDRAALQGTATCLQREGTTHYVLLGRADPRGTTEYNLALGERRARAVQRYLTALGVAEPRLAVSSVGSEGATGRDEAGWAQDRRVDSNRRDHTQQAHSSP